ncbi:hypothetical protein ASE75_03020 [Sphingomonas sp. Leaf17]|uniref:hypothetical protein n=1 Tax=Sphingomonas sp. Leaf17 TaxID=1735683 RepID=UPI0006F34478|nr:hypothetical protein [Sphingomonas sp. Leaf17]KQM67871.1 hypothetical protein ASE75_03020 [Sphingomonas sp. Leaf17]
MEEYDELASRLLALAGAIMEDASTIAILGGTEASLSERATLVASAATDVQLLGYAADIALRRR